MRTMKQPAWMTSVISRLKISAMNQLETPRASDALATTSYIRSLPLALPRVPLSLSFPFPFFRLFLPTHATLSSSPKPSLTSPQRHQSESDGTTMDSSSITPPNTALLISRLTHLSLLHSSLLLPQTSLFLSAILHSLLLPTPDPTGRLLFASALLATGSPHSALHLAKDAALLEGDMRLATVAARACEAIGRNREGRDILQLANKKRQERIRISGGVDEGCGQ